MQAVNNRQSVQAQRATTTSAEQASRTLARGAKGLDVAALQRQLNGQGATLRVDG